MVSNCIILSNKAVLSYWGWHNPLSLMLFQAAASVAVIGGGAILGFTRIEVPSFDTLLKILPLNVLFVGMICTSSFATQYLSVPFLTVFKNLTNVVTCFGENKIFGTQVSNGVLLALFIMVSGSMWAGRNDVEFSVPGYTWMGLNCCVTSSYVLYMKYAMNDLKLPKEAMSMYNNLIGVPMIAVMALPTELDSVLSYEKYGDRQFQATMVLSGFVGTCMSLASFYAMSKTSPTTYSMVGALNKIPASILGAFFFNATISQQGWTGISVGLLGGIVFAYVKATEKSHASQRLQDDEGEDQTLVSSTRITPIFNIDENDDEEDGEV